MSKVIGIKGVYLSMCKALGIDPIPITVPVFGVIRKRYEITSIHDNFGLGQIMDDYIEAYLRDSDDPLVIDCGVNVGITVRWWLWINDALEVVGIDMMEEAHKFTVEALEISGISTKRYKCHTEALWRKSGEPFSVDAEDPLLSISSLSKKGHGLNKRNLISRTLDSVFSENMPHKVSLLKIDLEGAGADALEGASILLTRTEHVCFEYHDDEERKKSSELLSRNGFCLRRENNRHLWWERGRSG
jgi:FkbM family methyltransferase